MSSDTLPTIQMPIDAAGRPQRTIVFRVDPAFAALLKRHGLGDCDALCDTECGTLLRRLPQRENWRLDLAEEDGTRRLYLKKHRVRTFATRWRAWFGFSPPSSAARTEAETTTRLAELGVPTMTVVAYGERLRPDGTFVAAFLSDELRGFEQLDLFLPNRFRSPTDVDLRRLILSVADVARRFHTLGFNHRDFYTCHIFIREDDPGVFAVHLIDLQRVQKWPKALRGRWRLKDLAQLAYSSDPRLIRASDRLRFFLHYLGSERLSARSKRFARRILRKAAALEVKHGPYRDWSAPRISHFTESLRTEGSVQRHEDRACA